MFIWEICIPPSKRRGVKCDAGSKSGIFRKAVFAKSLGESATRGPFCDAGSNWSAKDDFRRGVQNLRRGVQLRKIKKIILSDRLNFISSLDRMDGFSRMLIRPCVTHMLVPVHHENDTEN